jgi:TetR/AcrR family fatty acid metabolism transcriptional regulator
MVSTVDTGKRHLILGAAVQVFSEKGFHNARVEEIAQVAGIGKGTIYQYFSTKEQLFLEMVRAGMDLYLGEIRTAMNRPAPIDQRLCALVEMHLSFAFRHRNLARLAMLHPDSISDSVKETFIETRILIHREIVYHLDHAIQNGEIRPCGANLTAWMLIGILNSLGANLIFEETDDLDLAGTARDTAALILYGLKS